MCRLFGMSGGANPVRATFWLLEAPDSLARQSRRQPDGTGIGWYDSGDPRIAKQPIAAYEDQAFAQEARELESKTFVAHVRYATTGDPLEVNTHPFCQQGRIFAHNGVIGDLERLDRELGDAGTAVEGDTDSERFFALITREIERHDGDVAAGIASAAGWVAANLPVASINFILAAQDELWALRYPDTHELLVLERPAGGASGNRHLDGASAAGSVRVRSSHLSRHPAVIFATEAMDADPAWRPMRSGELLHIGADLTVTSTPALTEPPAKPMKPTGSEVSASGEAPNP